MQTNTTKIGDSLRHAHLSLLTDLKELAGAAPGLQLSALRTRLIMIRASLLDHFQLEETRGYLETVRMRAPQMEHALEKLKGEHQRLLASLDDMLAQLERAQPYPKEIQHRVQHWAHDVREHEISENHLVQDAFTVDLGAGD